MNNPGADNMVERVSRAICETTNRICFGGTPLEDEWREYVEEARAAIEAMREPTRDMCADASDCVVVGCCGLTETAARETWQAMIDQALKGE